MTYWAWGMYKQEPFSYPDSATPQPPRAFGTRFTRGEIERMAYEFDHPEIYSFDSEGCYYFDA